MLHLADYQWISTSIGWTMLHSIWQISAIGILWFLLLSYLKQTQTSNKHIISILAMLLIVVSSMLRLCIELRSSYPFEKQQLTSNTIPIQLTKPESTSKNIDQDSETELSSMDYSVVSAIGEVQTPEYLSPKVLKYLTGFWFCGILFFGLRFLIQWLAMQRLAHRGIKPLLEEQLFVFKALKNKLGIKKEITFLQSSRIASPLTFGHFKPIILLPIGMINGFPPEQIEAIILHELAHIQRNDFLINTIQTWVEILFFYHPIVWFISKQIRAAREELCDDQAISINKNKVLYAESLLNLQKYFFYNKNQLVMNAKSNKSELSYRIHRLFQENQTLPKKKRNINAYLFGLLFMIIIGTYAFSNFSYPTASISVDKMNILYIGIDNPITVAIAGVPTEKTKIESDDLTLIDNGNGHYNARATKFGTATIRVIADGTPLQEIKFRVKRISDPIARIGFSSGGHIQAEKIKEYKGIQVDIDNFEYDAKCTVTNYNMTWVAKNEDPIESINYTEEFNEKTKALLEKVKGGDILYFDNIKCNCPGDQEERSINSMVFKIK